MAGVTTGGVRVVLRLEGAAVLVGAVVAYALAGFLFPSPILRCAGLIWCAHIGFDRALGYGLKYAEGFGFTHLRRVGRTPAAPPEPATGRDVK